jgi:hydroxymethylpyrimidine/phosphomethylpyrimidine kinase
VRRTVPCALSIAGSDSGGGAGIQADLKTFTALGVFGMSVVTSVTAQNPRSVLGIHDLPHEFVELQIDAVLGDLGADAVKLGMLSNEDIVFSVAKKLDDYGMDKIVVDPVMVSTSGVSLSDTGAVKALIRELLPITYIVMPNLPEAVVLTGEKVKSLDDMKEAARKIKSLGPKYVLVKGGHLDTSYEAVDVLYDGSEFTEYSVPRIGTGNTHGSGCTYSAAVCAYLAKGMSMHEALKEAKRYVTQAISKSFNLGHGRGVLNHFWNFK